MRLPRPPRSFCSEDSIRSVVAAACKELKISKAELWLQIRKYKLSRFNELATEIERRVPDVEQITQTASLPSEANLNKIQRYEAHLSREFYKALHELQRLQAARLGFRPSVPVAVDIDVNSAPTQGIVVERD